MNKSVAKRLKNLADLMQVHEEALEKRFNPKTVAIVKYRVGLEDGALHSLEETAAYFKVSTNWVGKATRQVKNHAQKLMSTRDVSLTANTQGTHSDAKTGVMSAVIENGQVTVKHVDAATAERTRASLQSMLDNQKVLREKKMELSHHAMCLQKQADSKALISFIALLAALGISIVIVVQSDTMTPAKFLGGWMVVTLISLLGLIQYVRGVSCISERTGLLRALRKLG